MPEQTKPSFTGSTVAALFIAAAGLTLSLDLLTKHLAFRHIDPASPLVLIPGCLDLQLSVNRGAVFGIGQGMTALFVLFTLVAVGVILWAVCKYGRSSLLLTAGMGLLMGGALGNLWDRVAYGSVRDFIHAYAGRFHWPNFNIADSAICVGCAIIILYSFRSPQSHK